MSTIKTDNEDLVLEADGPKDIILKSNDVTKLTVTATGVEVNGKINGVEAADLELLEMLILANL